jgi:hypothetical protein
MEARTSRAFTMIKRSAPYLPSSSSPKLMKIFPTIGHSRKCSSLVSDFDQKVWLFCWNWHQTSLRAKPRRIIALPWQASLHTNLLANCVNTRVNKISPHFKRQIRKLHGRNVIKNFAVHNSNAVEPHAGAKAALNRINLNLHNINKMPIRNRPEPLSKKQSDLELQ